MYANVIKINLSVDARALSSDRESTKGLIFKKNMRKSEHSERMDQ